MPPDCVNTGVPSIERSNRIAHGVPLPVIPTVVVPVTVAPAAGVVNAAAMLFTVTLSVAAALRPAESVTRTASVWVPPHTFGVYQLNATVPLLPLTVIGVPLSIVNVNVSGAV